MGRIDKMVEYAVAIANDDWHGYSQSDRWYQDRDCSSLMYDSANYAGYSVGRGSDAVRYTGTMLADFTDAGFSAIPFSQVGLSGLKRGDILLNVQHHTEMYIGDGMNVGAHSSETGGIYGQPGDQTGNEISVTGTYEYWDGWDFVLRPPADSDTTRKKGKKMECLIRPDGKNMMVYFDGTKAHPLQHPDEMKAIQWAYSLCNNGAEIPCFEFGTPSAPWATRLFEGAGR